MPIGSSSTREKEAAAALRPVHHRNVGLAPGEPLDAFWGGTCAALGVKDVPFSVESFVGRQPLRTYFNTYGFSARPGLGLFRRWCALFTQLLGDAPFQEQACGDELHRIFLFQALWSVLVACTLDARRIRILPLRYNHPYNRHGQVGEERRVAALDELVSLTYEGRALHPARVTDTQIREPLRAWLAARFL